MKKRYWMQLEMTGFWGSAGCFEQEPLSKENPLWDMERVIITPHNSFISDKIYDRLFKIIYNNLQEFIVKDRCISNE